MARHGDLGSAVGIDALFAKPHSPWMRPTKESLNGHLRRYVGKGTDPSVYSQWDLDRISHRITPCPVGSTKGSQPLTAMKRLSLRWPPELAEVFDFERSNGLTETRGGDRWPWRKWRPGVRATRDPVPT